jgi:hypothetical protein
MAKRWAHDALRSAETGLSEKDSFTRPALSCASEVIKRMGGTEEQMVMVAGFAGGIGLSGHACGAYGAAVWMNSLKWYSENPDAKGYTQTNPMTTNTQIEFYDAVEYKVNCTEICGKKFNSVDEHSDFVRSGGCKDLIELLARS